MEQTKEFLITLKRHQVKRNQVTALHLMIGILLLLMGFVIWLMPHFFEMEQYVVMMIGGIAYNLFGLFLIVISIFLNQKILQSPMGNQILRIIEVLSLIPILIYSLIHEWYLPMGYTTAALLVILFAFFWERNAQKKQVIEINQGGILIPFFYKSVQLYWQDITNVVFRHAVFTVDCHDNRLYQFDVETNSGSKEVKEQIALFARKMIEAHKDLPRNDL